jgi:hypothetical protein
VTGFVKKSSVLSITPLDFLVSKNKGKRERRAEKREEESRKEKRKNEEEKKGRREGREDCSHTVFMKKWSVLSITPVDFLVSKHKGKGEQKRGEEEKREKGRKGREEKKGRREGREDCSHISGDWVQVDFY